MILGKRTLIEERTSISGTSLKVLLIIVVLVVLTQIT